VCQVISEDVFVRSGGVRGPAGRSKLTTVVQLCRLALFGCVVCVDGSTRQEDPVGLPSGRLERTARSFPCRVAHRRPAGSGTAPPCALPEAADLARSCPLWGMMSTYGATQF